MLRSGSIQHVSAGSLSLLVHGLLLTLLFVGVTWHSAPQRPVEAELWKALPEPPSPAPEQPPPVVKQVAKPEAVKSEVAKPAKVAKPVEVVKSAELAKPDLALERAKRQAAAVTQEAARRLAEDRARLAKEQAAAQAQKLQAQALRDKQRTLLEQEITNQARADMDAEDRQLRANLVRRQASDARRASLIAEAQDRIRTRILSYLHLPPNLVGNPEVVFQVTLLPNGEVLRTLLLRSSGQAAYDREVERAILKASPLPLPSDRGAADEFRGSLELHFRPQEDATAGG